MSSISHRINKIIKYKGMSIRAFESQAGITQGVLSNAIKKDSDIQSDNLSKIIDTYDEFNARWLLTGEGEMITDNTTGYSNKTIPVTNKPRADELPGSTEFDYVANDNNGRVPVATELNFALMDPENPTSIQAEDYYYIKEFRNADFLLRLTGDYMYPKYKPGDLVACRNIPYTNFYQWGRVYAILTCNQGLVIGRVYEHDPSMTFISIKPSNEAYPMWDIPLDDIAKVALVIGCISTD